MKICRRQFCRLLYLELTLIFSLGMAPLYNVRVNLWQASHSGLPESEITIAEITKQAGYKNAIIGK